MNAPLLKTLIVLGGNKIFSQKEKIFLKKLFCSNFVPSGIEIQFFNENRFEIVEARIEMHKNEILSIFLGDRRKLPKTSTRPWTSAIVLK